MKQVKTFRSLLILGVGLITQSFAADMSTTGIRERIAPVGQVQLAKESSSTTAQTSDAEAAPSGEAIYQSKCIVCHASGIAGAPKLGDKTAWAPRLAKGHDALLASVTNGLNAMPPMGTCMDCSEADLKATIDYMTKDIKH